MTSAHPSLDPATRWWATTLGFVLTAIDIADCWTAVAATATPTERALGAHVIARYYRDHLTNYGHPQHPQPWPVTVTTTEADTAATRNWADTTLVRTDTVYLDPDSDRFAGLIDVPAVALRDPARAGARCDPLRTVTTVAPGGLQVTYTSPATRPKRAGAGVDALVYRLVDYRKQTRPAKPLFGFAAGLELLEQLRSGLPPRFSAEVIALAAS